MCCICVCVVCAYVSHITYNKMNPKEKFGASFAVSKEICEQLKMLKQPEFEYYLAEFLNFKKLVLLKKKIAVSEQNPSASAHANKQCSSINEQACTSSSNQYDDELNPASISSSQSSISSSQSSTSSYEGDFDFDDKNLVKGKEPGRKKEKKKKSERWFPLFSFTKSTRS